MQVTERKNIEEAGADGLLVTGFLVGNASFGIDARLVLEVVKVGEVTPVHGAPPGVSGIRNLRGRIVTVVDMAVHLGLGCVNHTPETRLLIMEHQGEPFGFIVDAITDAIALDVENLGPPPASMEQELRKRLSGVWREGETLIAIIDAEKLFKWNDE